MARIASICVLAIFVVSLCAGCKVPGSITPEFAESKADADETLTALANQTPTVDPEDLIESGDTLEVVVRRGAGEEKYASTVRANGLITVSFMDINVKGLTEAQAESAVSNKLAGVIRNPRVQIRIAQKVVPRLKNYYVLGEVKTPGRLPLGRNMTLLQALTQAQGYTDVAALDKVVVISRLGEKPSIRVVNLENVLAQGDLKADALVQPNDVIFVPRNKVGDWNVYMLKMNPVINNILGVANGLFIGKAVEVLFRTPVQTGGASAPTATVPAGCWIATVLYGDQTWQVNLLRWYIWGPFSEHWYGHLFADAYMAFGQEVARLLRQYPILQSVARPIFDRLLRQGMGALAEHAQAASLQPDIRAAGPIGRL